MLIINNKNTTIENINRVITLLFVAVFFYALLFSWQSWHEAKNKQLNELETIMEIGSTSVDRYFEHLQYTLSVLSNNLIDMGLPVNTDRAFVLLQKFKKLNPELVNITLIQPDGQILLTATTPHHTELPSLALQPSFKQYLNEQQQNNAVSVGQPMIGVVSNILIIPLRHEVKNKEGHLVYIVSANLPSNVLEAFWKDAPITSRAALGVIRDDGFLVARYPVPKTISIQDIYEKPRTGTLIKYLQQNDFPVSGYVQGPSSLDGPDYLTAFRRLNHFPVTLFVAMPMSEIRQAWWNNVKESYFLSVILLVISFIAYRLFLNYQRKWDYEQKQAEAALQASEAKLRLIYNILPVGISITDRLGNLIDCNLASEKLLGLTREEQLQRNFAGKEWTIIRTDGSSMPSEEYASVRALTENRPIHDINMGIVQPEGVTWLSVSAMPSTHPEYGVVIAYVDITDLKQMQEQLRDQAVRDVLTGLFNRRYLDETLPRELNRCSRLGESLVVAMLDIDHFKQFNDTYGHKAGDNVLEAIGSSLSQFSRSSDLACRYGGEEFVIIMPGSSLSDALVRLNQLREVIQQLQVYYQENKLPKITVSIGVAVVEVEEIETTILLGLADDALYQAKKQGRNRVVVAQTNSWTG